MINYSVELTRNVPKPLQDYILLEESAEEDIPLTQLVSNLRHYHNVASKMIKLIYITFAIILSGLFFLFGMSKGSILGLIIAIVIGFFLESSRKYHKLVVKHPLCAAKTDVFDYPIEEGTFVVKEF